MKNKIKKITTLIVTFIYTYVFRFNVFAENGKTETAKVPSPVKDGFKTVPDIINTLMKYVFPVVGFILFVMIVYAGITKLTAAGNAEKEKQAMTILKNAIIGVAIVVLARVIVNTITSILGAPTI